MQLNYPDDFETPAFPAGRRIAISRAMAIGTMVVFLLIVFMCAILFWASRSARIHPFLISVNDATGQWSVVGHNHGKKTLAATRAIQESVIGNFVRDWFTVSDVVAVNDARWRTCERTSDCGADDAGLSHMGRDCAIYCATGDNIFSQFVYDIIPQYQEMVANGVRWGVNVDSMNISPLGEITGNGGTWRVAASISSNVAPLMNVVAYVKVLRNQTLYPRTLGFYVVDFNAYKIN